MDNLINTQLLAEIEYIIYFIEKEYRKIQGLILTEDDLKCHIFKKLSTLFQYRIYPNIRLAHKAEKPTSFLPRFQSETIDHGVFASSIHAELPWYDENNKLAIRPDITILEPRFLSILHGLNGAKLPSKQFEFGGQGIIFEIKFNRFKNGISPSFLRHIQDDFEKIQGLFNKLRNQGKEKDLFCFFIIFNKTDSKCSDFIHFFNQNRTGFGYKMLYCSGQVSGFHNYRATCNGFEGFR